MRRAQFLPKLAELTELMHNGPLHLYLTLVSAYRSRASRGRSALSATSIASSVRMVFEPWSAQTFTYMSNIDAASLLRRSGSLLTTSSSPATPPNTTRMCLHRAGTRGVGRVRAAMAGCVALTWAFCRRRCGRGVCGRAHRCLSRARTCPASGRSHPARGALSRAGLVTRRQSAYLVRALVQHRAQPARQPGCVAPVQPELLPRLRRRNCGALEHCGGRGVASQCRAQAKEKARGRSAPFWWRVERSSLTVTRAFGCTRRSITTSCARGASASEPAGAGWWWCGHLGQADVHVRALARLQLPVHHHALPAATA